MQHSLRRLALGAALAGATIAAAPAIASAASTCTFDPASQQVTIMDGSGSGPLILSRSGRNITYSDDWGEPQLCVKGVNVAGVGNTAGIYIQGPVSGPYDGYLLDESNGPFIRAATGNPEIKIDALTTGGGLPMLTVRGTSANDHIITGVKGKVDLTGDFDTDLTIESGVSELIVRGGPGDDTLDGGGYAGVGPSTVHEDLFGELGNDILVGGREHDELDGGEGDDGFNSYFDGYKDTITGGPGYDKSFRDAFDTTDAEYDVIARSL